MNQRQTFKDAQQLFSFVSQIFQQQECASLLIDRNGLERAEGTITDINPNDKVEEASIVLGGNNTILIKEIMGINGVFRSEYAEC